MSGDRPTPRPRPAPQGDDPVLPPSRTASVPAPPPVQSRSRRAPQALVQLNTRVLPLLAELVALVGDTREMSKRDVIETALTTAYAEEYKNLLASKQGSKRAR